MAKFTSFLVAIYFFPACFMVPPIIKMSWEIALYTGYRRQDAIETIIPMLLWVIGGFFFITSLLMVRNRKISAKIASVTPDGFAPKIELYGTHATVYLGISPATYSLVLVDLKRKIARYESMDFLQGYLCEYVNEHRHELTFQFNCFDVPSISFNVRGDRYRNDLIAKLDYALRGGGRQYGPEVAEASIQAFEALQKQYGIQKKSITNDLPPGSSTA